MPKDFTHAAYLREKAISDEQFALTDPLDRNPQDIKLAKSFGAAALKAFATITQGNAAETIRLLEANITAGEEILRRYRQEYIPSLLKLADYWPEFKNVPRDTPLAQQAVAEQVQELKLVRTAANRRFVYKLKQY